MRSDAVWSRLGVSTVFASPIHQCVSQFLQFFRLLTDDLASGTRRTALLQPSQCPLQGRFE